MEIRVTKKQNMVVDGVKYKAETNDSCEGCAFQDKMHVACGRAPCGPTLRDDERSVVFVIKKQKAK